MTDYRPGMWPVTWVTPAELVETYPDGGDRMNLLAIEDENAASQADARDPSARAWYDSTEESALVRDILTENASRLEAQAAERDALIGRYEAIYSGEVPGPDLADIAWETLTDVERQALRAWVDRHGSLPNVTQQYVGWGRPLVRDIAKTADVEALARVNQALAEIDRAERLAPKGVIFYGLEEARLARERRRRMLRVRVEPTGTTAPSWLTLLALVGWMRGVVVWDGVEPYDGVAPY